MEQLLHDYEHGPSQLQDALQGLTDKDFDRKPISGQWSIRQVVCHLADFEPVYADRIKRVLVEDNPTILAGDPDVFAAGLRYDRRCVHEELQLIRVVRKQMLRILRDLDLEDLQRTGVHSADGPLTLETLLERITAHVPHHLSFITAKIAVMRSA
ncbi:MAG: DinB family protein [Planctomycetaceae bacterium]|nr:DinB family protein [Planctomycetaceae bacterium]